MSLDRPLVLSRMVSRHDLKNGSESFWMIDMVAYGSLERLGTVRNGTDQSKRLRASVWNGLEGFGTVWNGLGRFLAVCAEFEMAAKRLFSEVAGHPLVLTVQLAQPCCRL